MTIFNLGGDNPATPDEVDAAVAAGIAGHEAAADPHPQYLTEAEADGLYDALGAAAAITAAALGAEVTVNKNVANGYAGLDANAKISNANLPPLAITETHVVASEAAMLAIVGAETGDVAVRTDVSKSFILTAAPASTLGNWQELLTPPNAVTSVDGRTGVVTLSDLYAPASGISPTAVTGTAVVNNDPRLTDARTPTAHKTSHSTGGTDALTPGDIGAAGTGLANTFTKAQSILNDTASEVPLSVRGASGQTANLAEMRGGDNTLRLSVTDTGYTTVTGNTQTNGGLRVGTAVTYSTNQRWVAIENAASAPSSVSSGAIVYADSGTLKVRTTGGVVNLGAAVETTDARLSDARTPTAHKTSHSTGGADALAPSDIGAVAVATGLVVVSHGSDASVARPTAGVVYWIGSVQPTNALNADLWYDTTGDTV
jgi:hypothetical protein